MSDPSPLKRLHRIAPFVVPDGFEGLVMDIKDIIFGLMYHATLCKMKTVCRIWRDRINIRLITRLRSELEQTEMSGVTIIRCPLGNSLKTEVFVGYAIACAHSTPGFGIHFLSVDQKRSNNAFLTACCFSIASPVSFRRRSFGGALEFMHAPKEKSTIEFSSSETGSLRGVSEDFILFDCEEELFNNRGELIFRQVFVPLLTKRGRSLIILAKPTGPDHWVTKFERISIVNVKRVYY